MKTAAQIVEMALTLVDEQVTDILDASDLEMSLTDVALSRLPEVARSLIKDLPFELKKYLSEIGTLTPEVLANGELQTSYGKRKLAFTPPSNFWELVSLKLTVWAKPVTSYILIDSPEYGIQNNPFTRGGKQNPVVAVSSTTTGDFRVECFSVNATDATTVASFEYISFDNYPRDTTGDEVTWPDELFEKITKALAAELNAIKGRMTEGAVWGEEAQKTLEQHK